MAVPPARNSLARTIDRRLRQAGQRDEAEFLDIRLDLVDEDTDRVICSEGGRWDARERAYSGAARRRAVIKLHRGQLPGARWLRSWMAAHRVRRAAPPAPPDFDLVGTIDDAGPPPDPAAAYSCLFAGGRRAGKTHLGVAACVLYAVAFPDSLVWIVCPNEKDFEEVYDYLGSQLPSEWIKKELGAPWWRIELANGSRIVLRSAYDPVALKKGRVDFALINEGQRCKEKAFITVRAAVSDRGGCVIVAANPPDTGDEPWVGDFAADVLAGRRLAHYVEFNPLLNPHIDRNALLALAREYDARTFEIEVLGRFLGRQDAVIYNWIRAENERPVPVLGDCTGAYTKLREDRVFRQVVSCDIQTEPYIAATVWRFFGTPTDDEVLSWCVDEIVLEGGDEEDICEELYARGYMPDDTLIVCDASGKWQHSRRRAADQPPPEWTGKGSFDLFHQAGYRFVVPPDRRMRRNPDVVERCRAFCARVSNYHGDRRLFIDTNVCPQTARGIRRWSSVHGKPSRTQYEAHIGDAATYFAWRFFPRRFKSGKPARDGADRKQRAEQRKAALNHAARLLAEAGAPVAAPRPARGPPVVVAARPPPDPAPTPQPRRRSKFRDM